MFKNKFAKGLKQLACGACGEELHDIFRHPSRDEYYILCSSCDTATCLTVSTPTIELQWVDDSKGKLAEF